MGLLYRWNAQQVLNSEQIKQLCQSTKLSAPVIQLLLQRGLDTTAKIKQFLNPNLSQLHDPYLLHDMSPAVRRINQAITQHEKMIIYGDYDADGITSTVILKTAIEQLGGQVDYYLPDRFTDGYGPNLSRYQKLGAAGYQLIITVDNGVSGMAALSWARDQGIDVVVTDHHKLPPQLPPAVAIVHPQYPQTAYPCPDLCGAGVAFKVATALLQRIPVELLDLAAIGTIADVVDLVDENRVLVAGGLQQIQQHPRLGIKQLAQKAHLQIANFSEEDIGFQIAPRLNALGRLDQAAKGVELLASTDESTTYALAQEIDHINQKRKQLCQEVYEQALVMANAQIQTGAKFLVIFDPNWHQGILGIVAGRILQQTKRPTLVLTQNAQGQAVGSGRSESNLDLYATLAPWKEKFLAFGGHAQACGLTMEVSAVADLQIQVNQLPNVQQLKITQFPRQSYDLALDIAQINLDLYQQLRQLAPFGHANAHPVLRITGFQTSRVQYLGKKAHTHLKINLWHQQQCLEAIGFNLGSQLPVIQKLGLNAVYGTLLINHWHNRPRLQVNLSDVEILQQQQVALIQHQRFRDWRNFAEIEFNQYPDNLIFFHQKNLRQFQKKYPQSKCYWSKQLPKTLTSGMLVDRPANLTEFLTVCRQFQWDQLDLSFRTQYPQYYQLQLSKDQTQECLKYFWAHHDLTENDLPAIAAYLGLTELDIRVLLNMFVELKFIKINQGVLQRPLVVNKVPFSQSSTYRQLQLLKEVQTRLIESKFTDLVQWIVQSSK